MIYKKALRSVLRGFKKHLVEAPRIVAFFAGKVRMALIFCAVMSELIVPCAVLKIGPVDDMSLNKCIERAVNCNLVRCPVAETRGN
jgi:hypothetical protein